MYQPTGKDGAFVTVGTTISGTHSGITLSDTADNPVAVTGTIVSNTGAAIYGQGGAGSNSWTINNSGSIHSFYDDSGSGIELGKAGNSVATGVVINHEGGQIAGVYDGVRIFGPGTVINLAGGYIGSGSNAGVAIAGLATVANYGTVTGGRFAVVEDSGGLIANAAGGTLSGPDAVSGAGAATVINDGLVTGGLNGVLNPGKIINRADGTINGGGYGAFLQEIGTVVNYGTVTGGHAAIEQVNGLVTNAAGGILSGGTIGVRINNDVPGPATVINAGYIAGPSRGVVVHGSDTVVNSAGGTIEASGTQGYGVFATGGDTVANYGIVTAGFAAVFLEPRGAITNAAGGTLSGGTYGVAFNGSGTLTNDGTIQGANDAVLFAYNDPTDRVIVDPGASFIGNVDGGSGTLELGAGNYTTGTLTGIGSSITNFSALQFDPGAKWEVAGQTGTAGFDTIGISGFASFDMIDVTNFLATSATFAGDMLTLTGADSASATLHIQGSFAANAFSVSPDGIGGSLIEVGRTIAGTYDHGITLTNTGDNPVAVTGTIDANEAIPALYGKSDGTDGWTISNSGSISNANWYGIGLGAIAGGTSVSVVSGIVSNEGVISGGPATGGVGIIGPGSVANFAGGEITGGKNAVADFLASGTVTNAGSMTGTSNDGIYLGAGGEVTNSGSGSIAGGIYAVDVWAAPGTVSNYGSMSGTTIAGVFLRAGGEVTNSGSGATITSDRSAVVVKTAPGTVSNSGMMTGTNLFGVYLGDGGTVTNSGSGSIAGGRYAVDVHAAAGTVTNAGSMNGTSNDGVYLGAGGTVTNSGSGSIAGGRYAVDVHIAPGTVSNSGSMTGTVAGVFLRAGGEVTNSGSGATITGDDHAVVVKYAPGAVSNSGMMTGTNLFGVYLGDGGTVTNSGSGSIAGGRYAVDVHTAAGTVTNAGSMTGTGNDGVYLGDGGTVTNSGSGSIAGGQDAVYVRTAPGTVSNSGSMTGTVAGVFLRAGGEVTNSGPGATITGDDYAVVIKTAPGAVSNSGVMTGTTYFGVYLGAGGTVTNSGSGSIAGGRYAVDVHTASGTVSNAASMTGTVAGVFLRAGGEVTNSGPGATITGDHNAVVLKYFAGAVSNSGMMTGTENFGVYLGAGGTVTNSGSGSITGGQDAVIVKTESGTVTNSAGMTGADQGLYLGAGGTVTNSGSGSITGGQDAVYVQTAPGTVTNAGSMTGSGTAGVYLKAGGEVTNASAALITGGLGVILNGAGGTVSNAGTIAATRTDYYSGGAALSAATVTNAALGTISGPTDGVVFFGTAGLGETLSNDGKIVGNTNAGIVVESGPGAITNATSGTIAGGSWGVHIRHLSGRYGSTFTNAGTVMATGTGGQAVHFNSVGAADRLVVDPGAVFVGSVYGGNGVVELASGSSTGALSGFGTSITNFSSLQFDPAAAWNVAGDGIGLEAIGTISGFAPGDTIEVTGVSASGDSFTPETGLVLSDGTTLHIQGPFSSVSDFNITPVAGDTFVTVACYLAGTNILTPSGETPVEQLAIGDLVITHTGEARPIVWIGRRGYDGRFASGNRSVLPIRIAAGALADGVPTRDLHVSPKHALWFDGVLIPAEKLLNGVSICQLEATQTIEYIHIELEAHDVILAEGAAAETFVHCDNRGMFQNSAEFEQLYPNASPPKGAYCMPLVESGEALEKVRQKLEQRLEAFGYTISVDPPLRLLVDGREIWPDRVDGQSCLFTLTRKPDEVRLVSRSSVPAEVTASTDLRRLGVNLCQLVLRGGHITCTVEHAHPALTEGFHEAERAHRWTDGDARIPPVLFDCLGKEFTIEVKLLGQGLPYRVGPEAGGQRYREAALCMKRA
jgi:hypothetical protein